MSTLTGQVAVVTGGGSGIGKAISQQLAEQGAHVWVTDIQEVSATRVAEEIGQKGNKASAYRLDVTDVAGVRGFFEQVDQECGHVDILVNNAGIAGNPSLLVNMKDEEWMRMFDIHVNGSFYCLREAAKRMIRNNYGRVINMSSLAAVTSLAGFAHYGAVKYALVGLTQAAAKELAGYQITVNAIKPGVIRSALTEGILAMAEEQLSEATPVKKIGSPEDIAKAVLMFAQPDSSFITGTSLVVDGAFSLMNEMDRVMLDALQQ
ncbi:SDR family NAD(P)-dependent oxidoreductase [Brevibacillus sp. SIMBA_040]|uniref:SDR family NAD(P)-dependent oxidoreductase n=1 Tax=unclassified Brevibacillus TaxID=2684853 RepID=UPI00397C613B